MLTQAMIVQANSEVITHVNPNIGTKTTRVCDFKRIIPLELHGSNVDEVHKSLLRGLKILWTLWFDSVCKEKLGYLLIKSEISSIIQLMEGRKDIDVGPLDWDKFKGAFYIDSSSSHERI